MSNNSSLKVVCVGFKYLNQTPECLNNTNEQLRFEPEPTNQYNNKAVALYQGVNKVGYVGNNYLSSLQQFLDNNAVYVVSVLNVYPASAQLQVSKATED